MKKSIILGLFLIVISCNNDTSVKNNNNIKNNGLPDIKGNLFQLLDPNLTEISFNNTLIETGEYNNLNYDEIYTGAGVAVGDINNDGLIDVYFAGNQSRDALFLNKGNFKFQDISKSSNIDQHDYWSTSVSMADINEDGYLDIYITKYLYNDKSRRQNVLLINNKDNTFTNQAKTYGVADTGFSTCSNFFDYNNDGLIDLYVGNQFNPSKYIRKLEKGKIDFDHSDRLYKNMGNGKFVDVTKSTGILNYAAALSVNTADLNNDGLIDIYVANDYEEPDYIYY